MLNVVPDPIEVQKSKQVATLPTDDAKFDFLRAHAHEGVQADLPNFKLDFPNAGLHSLGKKSEQCPSYAERRTDRLEPGMLLAVHMDHDAAHPFFIGSISRIFRDVKNLATWMRIRWYGNRSGKFGLGQYSVCRHQQTAANLAKPNPEPVVPEENHLLTALGDMNPPILIHWSKPKPSNNHGVLTSKGHISMATLKLAVLDIRLTKLGLGSQIQALIGQSKKGV